MGTGAWPRTMAVGERGWSAKETRDTDDALTRFHEWRCKSESARLCLRHRSQWVRCYAWAVLR